MMGLSAIVLGFGFRLQTTEWGGHHKGLLDGISFGASLLFGIMFSFGAGPIPFLLLSELAPPHIRGLASSVVQAFNCEPLTDSIRCDFCLDLRWKS